nr:MAG TPA: hypothetical protein [Caudoviricetes sp.]
MEEVQKYKLYAGKFQFISDKVKYSFVGSHNKYMLVFLNEKPEGKFTEVPDNLLKQLTNEEKSWLLACKTKINAEYMKKNEEGSMALLENFIKLFEKELKKEKRKKKE